MIMKLHQFLIVARKSLDAADIAYKNNTAAVCMYHLGGLHGLITLFIESEEKNKLETAEQDRAMPEETT